MPSAGPGPGCRGRSPEDWRGVGVPARRERGRSGGSGALRERCGSGCGAGAAGLRLAPALRPPALCPGGWWGRAKPEWAIT